MIVKLYSYFGIVGILSIVTWVSVAVLLVQYARREIRNRIYLIAFGLAVVAWVLGQVNSAQVNEIQVDRTREYEEGRLEQQRQRLALLRSGNNEHKITDIQFVEDATGEQQDVAGLTSNELAFVRQEPASIPSYKLAGKQSREVLKKDAINGAAAEYLKSTKQARKMPEADVMAANRLDRLNLGMLRFILWLSAGLVVWDYLRRFNRTGEFYFPLPLAGSWLDDLSPKIHTAIIDGADTATIRHYLSGIVQKGETFIYFGSESPLGGVCELFRLPFAKRPFLRLPVMNYGADATPRDAGFFFDGLWFNKCAVTVSSREDINMLMASFLKRLYDRASVRAVARQTVNLVWHFDALPDKITMQRLAVLVKQTNFRFVYLRSAPDTEVNAWAKEVTRIKSR